jgi:hypothetical protein
LSDDQPTTITAEQVQAYLAEQAAAEQAEDERVYHELMAWLAERDREIVVAIQLINGGQAAMPAWGVGKRRPQ